VRSGDRIRVSVEERRLELLLDEEELGRRRADAGHAEQPEAPSRGYAKLYADTVLQADEGCDFDFLRAASKS
jgi:dihydroxy-acid dehydratase